MNTIINAPRQLKLAGAVLAVAALLLALLAVTMTAGPTMAQIPGEDNPPATATPTPEPAATATPTPTPTPTPEPPPTPCGPGQNEPPANPDKTITEGHYGVFDGYWDDESETLNLNLCPPAVHHEDVTVTVGRETKIVEVSHRSASNINIEDTVFHIGHIDGITDDEQFEHVLTEADVEKYDFLKLHEDEDQDGVDDAVGTTVWWLKVEDEHDEGMGHDHHEEEESPLAMGFSAALFSSDYWYLAGDTPEGDKPLQYEFEVIREPGIPPEQYGHVFAFDDSEPPPLEDKTAYWDSSEADVNALPLYPGEYHHFQWIFTKPGTYKIGAQLKGHVRQTNPGNPNDLDYDPNWERISDKNVETSDVQPYTFHVGLMADIAVTISADNETPEPGTNVDFTVTASNAGPDNATNTEVQVTLPPGLTYVPGTDTAVTSESVDGDTVVTWDVGTIAAPATADDDPTQETLTVTATVGSGTRGEALEVTASTSAKESIGDAFVNELDPYTDDNYADVTVTPVGSNNDPRFYHAFSVPERSPAGTLVGTALLARDLDEGAALHYSLTGVDSGFFTLTEVEGGVEIRVAHNAILDTDYGDGTFDLALNVSDRLDEHGNPNSAVDDTLGVVIDVTEDADAFDVVLRVETYVPVNREALIAAEATNLPAGFDRTRLNIAITKWGTSDELDADLANAAWVRLRLNDASFEWEEHLQVLGTWHYKAEVWYVDRLGHRITAVTNTLTVNVTS